MRCGRSCLNSNAFGVSESRLTAPSQVWDPGSPAAVEDLKQIAQFIALDDATAAATLAGHILSRIEQAAEFPYSNRAIPEKADESVRQIILRPYRIVCLVDDHREAIYIVRVWHAARGAPDLQ